MNEDGAKLALSHADPLLAIGMGVGRLDVFQASAFTRLHYPSSTTMETCLEPPPALQLESRT